MAEAKKQELRLTPSNGENPSYGEPYKQGFVGVAPEYANFANETDRPYEAEEDATSEPVEEKKEPVKSDTPTTPTSPAK